MTAALIFGGCIFFFIFIFNCLKAGGQGEQHMTDIFEQELDKRKREN